MEVDQVTPEVIEKLPPSTIIKGASSILRHVKSYRWFIKDFSKLSKSLWNLLIKEDEFNFDADLVMIEGNLNTNS